MIINQRKTLYLFLFLIVFSYFLYLNSTPSFPDPDSFYHAKLAQIISQEGIPQDFTWLPFTTLSNIYIDHHLLYHLILVPLVLILPPLVAVKLAAAFFAALTILTFQWLLDKFKIKYSFIYTLILLFAHQFVFRINLAKVPSLSLIVLLLFIYFLFINKNKWPWQLFLLSFAYVWLYGGWPIAFGLISLYFLVDLVFITLKNKKFNWQILKLSKYKIFLSSIFGFVAGLVINPYFPTNLKFYYQQTIQIGLVNYKDIVGVGGEWYGFNIFDLVGYEVFTFILLTLALLIFFIHLKKQSAKSWTLFLLSLIFFILTLKSQRNVEYFIPFSLLFSSFTISRILSSNRPRFSLAKIKRLLPYPKIIPTLLLALLVFYLPIVVAANFKGLRDNLRKNYTFDQFKDSSLWLMANTSPGDIVFHDDWDDWPVFFYHNSHNRYIVGLDPTFMYFKSHRQYWRWRHIATGQTTTDICLTVHDSFYSNYIFVKNDNPNLKKNLDKDPLCQLAYKDSYGWIYQINL